MGKRIAVNVKQMEYNRAVLAYLREHSPEHAEELNVSGEALGWWNTVNYLHSIGKTPAQCGQVIAAHLIERPTEKQTEYATLAARLTASPMYQRLWREKGSTNAIGRLMMQRVFDIWQKRS